MEFPLLCPSSSAPNIMYSYAGEWEIDDRGYCTESSPEFFPQGYFSFESPKLPHRWSRRDYEYPDFGTVGSSSSRFEIPNDVDVDVVGFYANPWDFADLSSKFVWRFSKADRPHTGGSVSIVLMFC